jgi:purine nucleosidase
MLIQRRSLIAGAAALAASAANARAVKPFVPHFGARCRVMVVNDIAGDPDGLFSTAHAFMSPSTELSGFVGTHATGSGEGAAQSAELAREIARMMKLTGKIAIHEGSAAKLRDAATPDASPGAQAIVAEAMREDSKLPLYVTVGGGLTEVASALMLEPKIAERMTLVWIGGHPPAGGKSPEYNFGVDPLAARHVFNHSEVPIWQVPSDVYASCMVSISELQAHVAPHGEIGEWLYRKFAEGLPLLRQVKMNTGETWSMGDNPLVLLTALTAWIPSRMPPPFVFENTGGSRFDDVIAPLLGPDGNYTPRETGRRIRVYRSVDTRLMFGDFFAKMELNFGK